MTVHYVVEGGKVGRRETEIRIVTHAPAAHLSLFAHQTAPSFRRATRGETSNETHDVCCFARTPDGVRFYDAGSVVSYRARQT